VIQAQRGRGLQGPEPAVAPAARRVDAAAARLQLVVERLDGRAEAEVAFGLRVPGEPIAVPVTRFEARMPAAGGRWRERPWST
jgi:hypothetical protein